MSFRVKLGGLVAIAVFVTLASLLVPVYRQQRADLIQLEAQRLGAIARSTATAIKPESLDAIAAAPNQAAGAFITVRRELEELWRANGGVGSDAEDGIAVIRREGDRYRTLVHSQWTPPMGTSLRKPSGI